MASPDRLNEEQPSSGGLAKALRMAGAVGFTPELPLTLATGLIDMAGTGLGTLAGMAGSKLRGEDIDWDAAADTINDRVGQATYTPRLRGTREALEAVSPVLEAYDRTLHAGGGKIAEMTGSPALGAFGYGMANLSDPWDVVPLAGITGALRRASSLARSAPTAEVPSGGFGGKERGAWSYGDLEGVEGDFSLRSPTMDAFDRLKPQEQTRLPGRQLLRALRREGASKEELKWSGLDRTLDTDEVVSVAEARRLAEQNVPKFEWEVQRGQGAGPDPDEIDEAARNEVYGDPDLEYPEEYVLYDGDMGEEIGRYSSYEAADRALDELKDSEQAFWAEEFANDPDMVREWLTYESPRGFDLAEVLDEYGVESLDDVPDDVIKEYGEHYGERYARERWDDSRYNVQTEVDPDADPVNFDELLEYWEERVRENPEDYGLDAGDEPEYGEFTVGRESREGLDGEDYTVALLNVLSEGRYGRGNRPGHNNPTNTIEGFVEYSTDDPVLRQRELDRLLEREALPDINDSRKAHQSGHYGRNVMHTREMDYNAPEWGTVQRGTQPGDLPTTRPVAGGVEDQLDLDMSYPAPRAADVQTGDTNSFRLLEEAQSDVLQRGRKTGFLYAEEMPDLRANEAARIETYQRNALAEMPTAREMPEIKEFFDSIERKVHPTSGQIYYEVGPPNERRAMLEGDYLMLMDARRRVEELQRDPTVSLETLRDAEHTFWHRLYVNAPPGSRAEGLSNQIARSIADLPTMRRSPIEMGVPPAPMSETRQYMAHALRARLADAVREGKQYFGWTPGEVHSRRWGSASLQWGRDPNNPDSIVIGTADYGKPAGAGPVEENVRRLQQPFDTSDADAIARLDVNAPDFEERVAELVHQHLREGLHEYPNPVEAEKKRTQALIKMLREQPAGHYSPRAFGNESAYRTIEKDMERILRESGSSAEIRDVPMGDTVAKITDKDGKVTYQSAASAYEREMLQNRAQAEGFTVEFEKVPMRAIEIDPELARAVKRGLKLPY